MELIISSLICLTISIAIIASIFSLKGTQLRVMCRLEALSRKTERNNLPPELNQPLSERCTKFIKPALRSMVSKIPQYQKTALEQKLQSAGSPHGMNVDSFIILKYLILLIAVGLGVLSHSILSFFILLITGYLMPDFYLKSCESGRRDEILRSLPDILDLLSVSVEAGLSFDAALQQVIEKYHGSLSSEFEKTLQELNLGKSRREALRDMAERIDINDVSVFLSSIIQADQLGVSITNVLRLQSQQVRANRRMHAEEKAQKAPIKILIPLVLFVFPTLLIVLLGPAIIQLMDTFQ